MNGASLLVPKNSKYAFKVNLLASWMCQVAIDSLTLNLPTCILQSPSEPRESRSKNAQKVDASLLAFKPFISVTINPRPLYTLPSYLQRACCVRYTRTA